MVGKDDIQLAEAICNSFFPSRLFLELPEYSILKGWPANVPNVGGNRSRIFVDDEKRLVHALRVEAVADDKLVKFEKQRELECIAVQFLPPRHCRSARAHIPVGPIERVVWDLADGDLPIHVLGVWRVYRVP